MSTQHNARVDDTGTVYAIEPQGERVVGQYADVSPEEAIEFFVRKFNDTNAALVLIEQRAKNHSSAKELAESLSKVQEAVTAKAGIGNYEALQVRIDSLTPEIEKLGSEEAQHKTEAIEKATVARRELVEQIEKLAASDPQKIQWKTTTTEVESLFASWQEQQKTGPRIPKTDADELWKRFRTARQQLDKQRRTYFAELDSKTKEAKSAKEALIAQAEALAPRGAEGIREYKNLLESWKKSPRANKKLEDTLWSKFKAAGDVLYSAKKAQDTAEDESYSANLDAKLAVLADAENLLTVENAVEARTQLSAIQKRWDKAGKVPRAHHKSTEERMRKVETHVKKLEDAQWAASDPEKQARQDGLAGQITKKISELEKQLAQENDASKKKDLETALATQREWLNVVS